MPTARMWSRRASALTLADAFLRAVRKTATKEELAALMEAITRDLGFRHYALTRLWTSSNFDQDIAVLPEEDAVVPRVTPGDALIFLGSTLHGGGGNLGAAPRRGIVISYCLGWLKPFELQWLVYPPQVARHFSPKLASLVGYAQHRPNLGNVEGQCPSVLLRDHVPDYLPAIDALRPDQTEAAAMFVRSQRHDWCGGRRASIWLWSVVAARSGSM